MVAGAVARWVDDGGVAWVVAAAEEVVVVGGRAVVIVAARPPRWRQAACRPSRRASRRWVVVLVGGIGASVVLLIDHVNKKGTAVEYDHRPIEGVALFSLFSCCCIS